MPLIATSSPFVRSTACRNLKLVAANPSYSRRILFPRTTGHYPIISSTPSIYRYASTGSAATAAAPSDVSKIKTYSQLQPQLEAREPTMLNWETFFRLRRMRRRYNRASSILTAILGTTIGASVLGSIEVDPSNASLFGLDMLTVLGLAIVASGAMGWLAGPMLGGPLFKVKNRRYSRAMMEREKEFLRHIQRHRADPSSPSVTNPVPDYYGEKIGSLKEYRQWLKDQRAFTRGKSQFL